MFGTEMAEKSQERVTLNGVEPAMINLIVQYAYTSEINITKTNVQSLLSAANLLQVVGGCLKQLVCFLWYLDILLPNSTPCPKIPASFTPLYLYNSLRALFNHPGTALRLLLP